jgi:hypothetical protein
VLCFQIQFSFSVRARDSSICKPLWPKVKKVKVGFERSINRTLFYYIVSQIHYVVNISVSLINNKHFFHNLVTFVRKVLEISHVTDCM